MKWVVLILICLWALYGVVSLIAENCFDDEDPDMDPWNSYK